MPESEHHFDFKEHLLKRRLRRLPTEKITKFWENEDIDFTGLISQKDIVDKIITEYKIKFSNQQFTSKFKDFLRDVVLTAREADYLISINNSENIIEWIQSWSNNTFVGQQHNFQLHTIVELNHKFLPVSRNLDSLQIDREKFKMDQISFPRIVGFIVASSKTIKRELDGLEEISYYPTKEFEIILRKDLDIVEVRGAFQVVKDFVSTAILDRHNPLSSAESYFIGEKEDSKKAITKVTRQIIRIDTLKHLLDGSYTKLSSPFNGTKISNFEVTLDDLKNIAEETHPEAQAVLQEMMKNPVKGNICFCYNQSKYSFSVTKTGGLLFREYIPEEVVTYILYNIKLSAYVLSGN